jgi:hypothetical protein
VLGELLVRFVLGGAIVSVFAVVGSMFKPKTFAGLFGAAPSVGIASLALSFHHQGSSYAATEAKAMVCGTLAMLVYCAACVALARRSGVPVWAAAGAAWLTWFAVAFAALGVARLAGLS